MYFTPSEIFKSSTFSMRKSDPTLLSNIYSSYSFHKWHDKCGLDLAIHLGISNILPNHYY